MAQRRFNMTLLASFAVLAVGLALVGVYGVVSYAAAQRTREIGIRVALGASRRDVVGMIVRGGLQWSIAGVIAGTLGAYAATRLMTGLLFDISPTDPVTFMATAAAMIAVSAAASYIPASRAASVDPIAALRTE
jgi:ABC-type antimicrobial peptide transport system permease subunit